MQNLLEKLRRQPLGRNGRRPKVLIDSLPETPGIYIFLHKSKIIYIGKAINLKRRISSYFDLDLAIKTARMVKEATDLSFIQVSSELEALLLEAKLIRAYMPHYNIAAKDDKHPLYILITRELYPRVITARKVGLNNGPSLAIYGPFPSSSSVYTVLRMLRRIFPYSDHKIAKRACLYSHIGLCNPCPNEVELITNSEERKTQRKEYIRNIRNIKSILDGNIDKVSKGLEREMTLLSKTERYEEALKARNQLAHLEYITRPQMPSEYYMENPNLLTDIRKREIDTLQKLLAGCHFAIKNLTRIECFDVAHLAGTNATASMVTFINGEPDKTYYRHFKIKEARGGDDYGSMREVARRRAVHFVGWGRPDLIIVDGGSGQVSAFKEKIIEIPIIGIAKHPDRLIIGDQKIKLQGVTLQLVSRMRDEAHRFARRYHHSLILRSITNANNF